MDQVTLKKEIIEWIKTICTSLLISLVIITFARPTIVDGHSMNPTLKHYDILLMNQLLYKTKDPAHGDVIIFKLESEGRNLVKRVIGIEGDLVEIKDGRVFVNGIELEEDYILETDISSKDLTLVVPEGKFFVLGDNRNGSKDSRSIDVGPVDEDIILGKAYFRLFPFTKIGVIE